MVMHEDNIMFRRANKRMSVITLSWQLGCLGDQIAEDVAAELNYSIIGRPELHELLVNLNGSGTEELEAHELPKVVDREIQPDFFFRLDRDSSMYSSQLISLLYNVASQNNVIIKRFGANLLLGEYPYVLSARIQGSLEVRTHVIQEQRNLDYRKAKKAVVKDDRERMGFVQYLFSRELTDLQSYDMLLDVGKIPHHAITEMIVTAARSIEATRSMTPDDQQTLRTRALENRIKSVIQKTNQNVPNLNVEVNPDGAVTLEGNVVNQHDKSRIEERVKTLPEVQHVKNTMTVGSPFRRKKRKTK